MVCKSPSSLLIQSSIVSLPLNFLGKSLLIRSGARFVGSELPLQVTEVFVESLKRYLSGPNFFVDSLKRCLSVPKFVGTFVVDLPCRSSLSIDSPIGSLLSALSIHQ
jgi:hypothetical protein